jgi:hypothetical protein
MMSTKIWIAWRRRVLVREFRGTMAMFGVSLDDLDDNQLLHLIRTETLIQYLGLTFEDNQAYVYDHGARKLLADLNEQTHEQV